METRKCRNCNNELSVEYFSKHYNRPGLKPDCKDCCKLLRKKYCDSNRESIRKTDQNQNYKRKYGITYNEYLVIYNSQNGKCLICDNYQKKLCVDHNHNTGSIRGLLCRICNTGLGRFGENIELMKNTIRYLNENM